jgi:mRNA-degrading endonuclease RelE of RelBE toxin-antitoxin system
MGSRRKFDLVFAPEVIEHLDEIEAKHCSLIERTIDQQLLYTPTKPTKNRKPLEAPAPFGATWELRLGPQNRFRVFYEVNEINCEVHVLAIGVKDHERLFIGGKEYTP